MNVCMIVCTIVFGTMLTRLVFLSWRNIFVKSLVEFFVKSLVEFLVKSLVRSVVESLVKSLAKSLV